MSNAKPYTMEDLLPGGREIPGLYGADRLLATVAALDAAQAEVTALRARVAELEVQRDVRQQYGDRMKDERDEWKARAEAAEKVRGELVQLAATAEVQRDEAAALAERMREALTGLVDDGCPCAVNDHSEPCEACARARAALSAPAPAWLRERHRALAMRVAEAAYAQGHADGRGRPNPAVCAAIVAEVVP